MTLNMWDWRYFCDKHAASETRGRGYIQLEAAPNETRRCETSRCTQVARHRVREPRD